MQPAIKIQLLSKLGWIYAYCGCYTLSTRYRCNTNHDDEYLYQYTKYLLQGKIKNKCDYKKTIPYEFNFKIVQHQNPNYIMLMQANQQNPENNIF